ncbi:hypothetical protein DFQ14_106148 [Halopolyspora algeriensis]|uniref:Uncharacterized protein n=1 Tax=Halopolyspora algeriensis TaxID=1500506 RepID=A0A368VQ48_9ACTN|nr:hypothetical protein [Halopolyspora algeriensis]RCW43670.1 hypothetical protein DFQ14_106148 [Halopolyspora algeriensis]TQM47547.1 hypothetical protein FHU43_3541 [Halopolyspora algeriensis]
MSERSEYEQLATALAHMARDLLSQHSVQDTLNRIAEYSVELIEGVDAAWACGAFNRHPPSTVTHDLVTMRR